MKKIILSEHLKKRGRSDKNLLFVLPFVSIFIAFLLVGPNILESFSIYWWEALFLFTLFGLLFLYDYKSEEQAGDFQNIRFGEQTPMIYLAKIVLKLADAFLSSLAFVLLLYAISFLFSNQMVVDLYRDSICFIFLLISAAWNVPFLYFLSKWVNPYLLLAINSLSCLLLAPFVAQTSIWFLFPYTYHYKVAHGLLHIKPSGDLDSVVNGVSSQTLLLAVGLSVALFISCLLLLKWRLANEKNPKK